MHKLAPLLTALLLAGCSPEGPARPVEVAAKPAVPSSPPPIAPPSAGKAEAPKAIPKERKPAPTGERIYTLDKRMTRPVRISGTSLGLAKFVGNRYYLFGTCIFRTVVRRDGSLGRIEWLRPRKIDKEYAAAVQQEFARWRFQPATLNGRSVAVWYYLTIDHCPLAPISPPRPEAGDEKPGSRPPG